METEKTTPSADTEQTKLINEAVQKQERSDVSENRRKRRKNRRLIYALSIIGVILLSLTATVLITRAIGKSNLEKHAQEKVPELKPVVEEEEQVADTKLPDGYVKYNSKIYQFNENIMTFLCLGIDAKGTLKEKTPGKAGQSDSLFLIVMNPDLKKVSLINIPRDAVTLIDTYDVNGQYVDSEEAQITLQFAYGDGREKSCEMTEQVVSRLFYNLPINGYAAMSMAAIGPVTDAVGGVEVEVLEDLTKLSPDLVKGETVVLHGDAAYYYVEYRNCLSDEVGTNLYRMDRQKQYLSSLFATMKSRTNENISLIPEIYQTFTDYMVTSVSLDEMSYLATTMLGYSFSTDDITTLAGEYVREGKYDMYHIDEDALYDLMIDTFYIEKGDVR
ncbi:MAG: LCP family protein [Lachnospiraceae bacterium]|nr:LCP family protein [Lachnospiraceae bacterium]